MAKLSRARGCLLGQAVGDALGTTVEFQSPARIKSGARDDAWPDELVGGGPFDLLSGQVTDDTELALALARSISEKGSYHEDHVARSYMEWAASDPFDIGNATQNAFGGARPRGRFADHVRKRAQANLESQANGSLMRISPLGVFGHAMEPSELAALAARDAVLSHPHSVCQSAAAVYTVTIAQAIRGEGAFSGKDLHRFALEFAASLEWTRPVVPWLQESEKGAPADVYDKQGWVRWAFTLAFHHLRNTRSFSDSLKAVVQMGGDTDTNGAIVGALLGAALGEGAIPRSWKQSVLACRPKDRPAHYHCHDLEELAGRLLGE